MVKRPQNHLTRKETQVTIGKRNVTIREITPVEAIEIADCENINESLLDVLLTTCDLTEKIFISFKQKDVDELFNHFQELNSSFFDKKKQDGASQSSSTEEVVTPTVINRHVCRLIMAGHGQSVWGYGWSFFIIALDELDKSMSDRLHDMAIASRASGIAEKDFKSFINTLS